MTFRPLLQDNVDVDVSNPGAVAINRVELEMKRTRPESGYYRYLNSVSSADHEAAMSSERSSPLKRHHLSLTKEGELSFGVFLVERLISERPSKTHKVVQRMVVA